MIADGKKIADDIRRELQADTAAGSRKLRLAIVLVGDVQRSLQFIRQKEKFAESVGMETRLYRFPADISTTKLRTEVSKISHIPQNHGVIVQLPLPEHINAQNILNAVVSAKDVDVLSARAVGDFVVGTSRILPPVAAAVRAILNVYKKVFCLQGKRVIVVGSGRLVGRPVSQWCIQQGATVTVVDEHTDDISSYTKTADIVISGAGKPNLITGAMLKDGAIAIDAGASESVGKILGDIDIASVERVADVLSPVPGGIGPITVAMVFKNLAILNQKQKTRL